MTIDGRWSYLGSSNLDSRSLRLNFETDLEVFDTSFAAELQARISARQGQFDRGDDREAEKQAFPVPPA